MSHYDYYCCAAAFLSLWFVDKLDIVIDWKSGGLLFTSSNIQWSQMFFRTLFTYCFSHGNMGQIFDEVLLQLINKLWIKYNTNSGLSNKVTWSPRASEIYLSFWALLVKWKFCLLSSTVLHVYRKYINIGIWVYVYYKVINTSMSMKMKKKCP